MTDYFVQCCRTEVVTGSLKIVQGIYTITPAFGSILPGQSQVIMVDCNAERQGLHQENISIEISDQERDSAPLSYTICGDVHLPRIETADVADIFEEHRVCKKLGALGHHLFHEQNCVGVYGEEERGFVFKSVVVGKTSVANFKITNPSKVRWCMCVRVYVWVWMVLMDG